MSHSEPLSTLELEAAVCDRLGIKEKRRYRHHVFGPEAAEGVSCTLCGTILSLLVGGIFSEDCPSRESDPAAVTGAQFDLVVRALAERKWGWKVAGYPDGDGDLEFSCTLYEPSDWWIGKYHSVADRQRSAAGYFANWREAVCRAVVALIPAPDPSRCHYCNGPLIEGDSYCRRCGADRAVLEMP